LRRKKGGKEKKGGEELISFHKEGKGEYLLPVARREKKRGKDGGRRKGGGEGKEGEGPTSFCPGGKKGEPPLSMEYATEGGEKIAGGKKGEGISFTGEKERREDQKSHSHN